MIINSLTSALAAAEVTSSRPSATAGQVSDSAALQSDSPQVSKLGSSMKQLENLQQTNPDKFKEVTATIAQKLEDAAKAAAASGDTQQASALNDLAAKFKTASETGKMPHLHRGHGGGHALPPPDLDSDSSSTSSTASSSSSSDPLSRDLAKLLAKYTQNPTVDPMSTLSGIMTSALG